MPFEQGAPSSFTAVSIQNNAPDSSGVYGLSNSREWILVGEANNIRAALMDHLREAKSVDLARRPTGFSYEIAHPNKRATRKNELARELTPAAAGSRR
jgi:excinuclease UvrABC nuclease subunit